MTARNLDERLNAYADLSEDERAALRAEVRTTRPDLVPALEEEQALAEALDAARQTPSDDPTAALVDARLGYGPEPPPDSVPEGGEAHLERLAAETEPPLAQFERLTGRRLPPLAEPADSNGSVQNRGEQRPGASSGVDANGTTTAARPLRFAADRSAARQRRSVWQRGVLAGLTLAAVYGGLFAASALSVPERARVADIGDVEDSFRPVRSELSDRYAEAVGLLDGAEQSTLGLFPSYDPDALAVAEDAFETIAREQPEGLYGQEAALALGRLRLLQGDDEGARIALAAVVAQRGHRAPEAARLLDYLDAEARETAE